jgi:hypothetical protein
MEEAMTRKLLLIIPALLIFISTAQTQDTQSEIERKDREYVREMFKKIYGPGNEPKGWEEWPKFMKEPNPAKAIADEWYVEFNFLVSREAKNFDVERERILATYGGELIHKLCGGTLCGFSFRASEDIAERISTDSKVRRVRQNTYLKLEYPNDGLSEPIKSRKPLNAYMTLPPPPPIAR